MFSRTRFYNQLWCFLAPTQYNHRALLSTIRETINTLTQLFSNHLGGVYIWLVFIGTTIKQGCLRPCKRSWLDSWWKYYNIRHYNIRHCRYFTGQTVCSRDIFDLFNFTLSICSPLWINMTWPKRSTYLHTYPPTYVPTYPLTHLPTYLPTHLPTFPPVYLN